MSAPLELIAIVQAAMFPRKVPVPVCVPTAPLQRHYLEAPAADRAPDAINLGSTPETQGEHLMLLLS